MPSMPCMSSFVREMHVRAHVLLVRDSEVAGTRDFSLSRTHQHTRLFRSRTPSPTALPYLAGELCPSMPPSPHPTPFGRNLLTACSAAAVPPSLAGIYCPLPDMPESDAYGFRMVGNAAKCKVAVLNDDALKQVRDSLTAHTLIARGVEGHVFLVFRDETPVDPRFSGDFLPGIHHSLKKYHFKII